MNNSSYENSQTYNTQDPRGDITGDQQAYDQTQRSGFQPTSTGQNIDVGRDQRGFQGDVGQQAFQPQTGLQEQAYNAHKSNLDATQGQGFTPSNDQQGSNFGSNTGAGNMQQPAYDQQRSNLNSNTGAGNFQQPAYDQQRSNLDSNTGAGNFQQPAYDQQRSNLNSNTGAGNFQQQAYDQQRSNLDSNTGAGNFQQQAYDQQRSNLNSNTGAGNFQQPAYDQQRSNLDSNAPTGTGNDPQPNESQFKSNTGTDAVPRENVAQQAYDQHKSKLDFESPTGTDNVEQQAYDQHKSNLDSHSPSGTDTYHKSELDTTVPTSGATASSGLNAEDRAYHQHQAKMDFDSPAADTNVQKHAYEQHKSNLDNKEQQTNKDEKVIVDPRVVKSAAREEKIASVIDKLVAKVENVLGLKDKAEIRQATSDAKAEHVKELKETGEFKPSQVPHRAIIADAYNSGQDVSNLHTSSANVGSETTGQKVEREAYKQHKDDLDTTSNEDHYQDSTAPGSKDLERKAYDDHKQQLDRTSIEDHYQNNAASGGQNIRNADRNSADDALGGTKSKTEFDESNPAPYIAHDNNTTAQPTTTGNQVASTQRTNMPGAF